MFNIRGDSRRTSKITNNMTTEFPTNILLQCIFCMGTEFLLPNENYKPKHGDMLTCANCGRKNDYDSIMRVAIEEATKETQKTIMTALKETLRGAGFTIK